MDTLTALRCAFTYWNLGRTVGIRYAIESSLIHEGRISKPTRAANTLCGCRRSRGCTLGTVVMDAMTVETDLGSTLRERYGFGCVSRLAASRTRRVRSPKLNSGRPSDHPVVRVEASHANCDKTVYTGSLCHLVAACIVWCIDGEVSECRSELAGRRRCVQWLS